MLTNLLPDSFRQKQWVSGLLNGILLFFMLLIAVYLATQQREAPQLILILLLYVITVNLTLPAAQEAVGLVPVVSVTSALILSWQTAIILSAFSLLMAALTHRLWNPIWDYVDVRRPNWIERLARAIIYLIALALGAGAYHLTGGGIPPVVSVVTDVYSFIYLALVYSITYLFLSYVLWLLAGGKTGEFLSNHTWPILMVTLLAQPFALFGATAFGAGGIPIFVVYCLSVMFIAVLLWVNWQQRFTLEQQHQQFVILNAVGSSLRETLDLSQVIERTWRTMSALIPAERYTVALLSNDEDQQRVQVITGLENEKQDVIGPSSSTEMQIQENVDDFTAWVIENGRSLEITTQDMHFASRHNLIPPDPRPAAWLGVPLHTIDETIGALVIQRFPPSGPFSPWSKEVLLAVAGQASAAIQNARLYRETLRLYNRTDQALAERVKQLQALLDSMHEGVLMLDPAGKIILINNVAAEMIGRPANSLDRRMLRIEEDALKLGQTPDQLRQLLHQLQEEKIPESMRFTFETQIIDDSSMAKRRYMERMEAPVLSASGQVIGWLMLFRDVTEEQELATQRRDLTRMIVHDLRNPVTTFISSMDLVNMLLPQNAGLEAAREAVKDASQSSYDMLDMVDSLMDINRMEAGQLVLEEEAVDMSALIKKVIRRLDILAEQRQIQLTQNVDPDLPLAWADEEIIRRVLVNLIDNAIKYTPKSGQVHCRAVVEPPAGKDREPGVRCIISDTGPGIAEEDRDQIFNRFARTNRGGARIRGTGLGLAFCKLAVEAHNSRIWMEPLTGGGSKFVFTLPGVPILSLE